MWCVCVCYVIYVGLIDAGEKPLSLDVLKTICVERREAQDSTQEEGRLQMEGDRERERRGEEDEQRSATPSPVRRQIQANVAKEEQRLQEYFADVDTYELEVL